MTTKGWIPIFSNLSHAVAEWLGWPEGTLFCADTVCKEINRRSGKTMESPFSGPLAGHGDNSVPGTERSACSAASGEQMNNGKCLSDKAPGARARPREAGISATSGTLFPLRKEDFLHSFLSLNYVFTSWLLSEMQTRAIKGSPVYLTALGSNHCTWCTFFLSPFLLPPPSILHCSCLEITQLLKNWIWKRLLLWQVIVISSHSCIYLNLNLLILNNFFPIVLVTRNFLLKYFAAFRVL